MRNFIYLCWSLYKNHVRKVVLNNGIYASEQVSYWQDAVFCKILTYLTPLSLIAVIPGVFMAFMNGVPIVGFVDLFTFFTLVFITIVPGIKLELRKSILIFILYGLSVTLLYYLPLPGPGLLFLLAITIFSSLIYSSSVAYFSAWINTFICVSFALLIHLEIESVVFTVYNLGSWIAVSSNLVLLSFACAKCLDLLLSGLNTSLKNNRISEAKLEKANRHYQFISQINQTIVHAKDAQTIFSKACNIALECGKYKMAWIGCFDTAQKKITLIEESGLPEQDIKLFTDLSYETNGPEEYVLSTGKYFLCNDIEHNLKLESWKPFVAKYNIRSCIIMPIRKSGTIFGTFNLYATELNFFNEEDIALLVEVTGDISFALDLFEKAKRHKEAEEQILKNEKRFRALIEHSSDMKTLANVDGKFIYASPAVTKKLGYTIEEFLETSAFNLIHPEDIPALFEKMESLLKTPGYSFTHQHRILHKNQNWIWSEGTMTNMLDEPGVEALVSNFRDISERKAAEEQKEFDSNNMYALINNTGDLMWSVDRNFHLITSNKPFDDTIKQLFGVVIEKGSNSLSQGFPEEQLNRYKEYYKRAFAGETFKEIDHNFIPEETWVEISYTPIRNEKEIIGVACHLRDVTTIKKGERQIKESEEQIKTIYDASIDVVIIINEAGEIIKWDSKAENLFGWTEQEVTGTLLSETIIPHRLREAHNRGMKHFLKTGDGPVLRKTIEVPAINKNNEEFDISLRICPSKVNDKYQFIGFIRDLTEIKNTQQQLSNVEAFNRGVLNSLSSHIAVIDSSGDIVAVNESWKTFAKKNGETNLQRTAVGSNYFNVCSKAVESGDVIANEVLSGLKAIMDEKEKSFYLEYPCHSPTEQRWFGMRSMKFDSDVPMIVVSHLDITERRKAEAEMLLLINNTEEAFILLDSNLKIVSFNNQFKKLYKKYFGLEIQKGDAILDYAQFHRKEIAASIYEKVLQGNVEESEITVPYLNNTIKYFSLKYTPAKDESGSIYGAFVTAIDITEKKKAEEQKEFERRNKEALINSTDDLIWSITNDFKLIAANNSFISEIKKYTGVEIKQGEDLLNTNVYPDDYIMYWKKLYNMAFSGESFKMEIYTPHAPGRDESWTETSFNPIIVNEHIAGIACYSRNITEQKKSELQIRASEARLAEAQEIAKIGNWETDLGTMNVIWSEQTFRVFDCRPEDFKSSHTDFLNHVHPDDRAKVEDAFNNSFNKKSINSIEHRILTKSGQVKYVEERWQIFHDDNNIPVKAVGTCQDISERKKSEHENKFKAELLDTIGQAVLATDLHGIVTFWNRAAVKTYGWTLDEAIGKKIIELTPSMQTKEDAEKILEKLSQGESWTGEFYVKRKNGNVFPAYVSNLPVYDQFGKQIGIIGVSEDISKRKEHELERAKISNDLLQRNRDLEQFTFIISHNLRAPTANIIGFTEYLQTETLSPQVQKEMLKGLASSVAGLDNIIKDLNSILQVKREINEKKEIVIFSKLVRDIIISIGSTIDKNKVHIKRDFTEVDKIFSLKVYMHSIFYNLISNSIKYRKPDEQPIIEIKSKKENGKIIVTFKDNGLGIDMKTKGDKVFGLYKRFHTHVEGKGMGLFMVKTQVEAIGGHITVASELNKGTEFTIEFET